MSEGIRQICALSVLCGLALGLMPEGGVKKMAGVCAAVLMLLAMLGWFRQLDLGAYSLELARYRELGQNVARQGSDGRERLNKLVIENECEQYILNRAAALGIGGLQVKVTARWSTEGFWTPDSVRIDGGAAARERMLLTELIAADLGVGEDKQIWGNDGS